MYYYAQLDENNICIGISRLSGEVTADNMIALDSYDMSKFWHKYENSTWSTDTYESTATTAT